MDPLFGSTTTTPLWDDGPLPPTTPPFTLTTPTSTQSIIQSVQHPLLLTYNPTTTTTTPLHRSILIIGGGGYTSLMLGREGIQIATWLTTLGFHSHILIHRFPNSSSSPQAPLDDARRALRIIKEQGFASNGLGVCGLSSGGHLAAALLCDYPGIWKPADGDEKVPGLDFAIIGYAPISTNAVGRTVVEGKAPLEPREKQELYQTVQPDVQLRDKLPKTFVVYSGNDEVVPVVNAYRLAEGLMGKGGEVELHVFADAPHGFAVDTVGLPVSRWTELCEGWLGQKGFLG